MSITRYIRNAATSWTATLTRPEFREELREWGLRPDQIEGAKSLGDLVKLQQTWLDEAYLLIEAALDASERNFDDQEPVIVALSPPSIFQQGLVYLFVRGVDRNEDAAIQISIQHTDGSWMLSEPLLDQVTEKDLHNIVIGLRRLLHK